MSVPVGDVQEDRLAPDDRRRSAVGRHRQLPRDVLGLDLGAVERCEWTTLLADRHHGRARARSRQDGSARVVAPRWPPAAWARRGTSRFHETGSPVSALTPFLDGPRQCGQLPATSASLARRVSRDIKTSTYRMNGLRCTSKQRFVVTFVGGRPGRGLAEARRRSSGRADVTGSG